MKFRGSPIGGDGGMATVGSFVFGLVPRVDYGSDEAEAEVDRLHHLKFTSRIGV